jgi:hypothetical protein
MIGLRTKTAYCLTLIGGNNKFCQFYFWTELPTVLFGEHFDAGRGKGALRDNISLLFDASELLVEYNRLGLPERCLERAQKEDRDTI